MRCYAAEMIGTFALVLCGTGAIIVNDLSNGTIGHAGIALTFGLIVLVMIYTLGECSGAHLNPAVTLAFCVAGRFPIRRFLPYAGSQLIGALLASMVLHLLFPEHSTLGATMPKGSDLQSFILETILTFLLMFVILNVSSGAQEKGNMAGIAVGATVALEAMFAGPICGASMNPVRSLAPALVSGSYHSLWVYCTAPFLGALLAVPAFSLVHISRSSASVELP